MYSDEAAAALYGVLNPWGPSDDFYLALVIEATSVLDVGCGTGALLHRARQASSPTPGFEIEAQHGGWFREPLDPASPEIITVARV